MDQVWAEQDFVGTVPVGDGNAGGFSGTVQRVARLLAVGPTTIDTAMTSLSCDAGVRLLGRVDIAQAAERLDQTALADIVWLSASEPLPVPMLSALRAALDRHACALVCETSADQIDTLYGWFSDLTQVAFLTDPQPIDRRIALATVTTDRSAFVRDVAGDGTQERLDRLQDEVARISLLLGQLSLAGDNRRAPMFPAADDELIGFPSAVRSPVRTFTAEPGALYFDHGLSAQRQRARQIRHMIRRRRLRDQFFPADLFADPAWDMLLDLYAAQLEGQPVSVSSLCIAAAVPATTALRWIKTMTDADIFERQADPHDGRRVFIALGAQAKAAMARYFEALDDQQG